MTSDIHLAFAHPEARAAATADAVPRDRISLRDHVVLADIGAFQTERGVSQRLRFNLVVELRPHPAPVDDDVDRILSYDVLTEAIAAELAVERVNLLETLSERIAERILSAPQAMRVFVRVEKLDRGPGALGVEIVRSRAETPLRAVQPDGSMAALHPLVVWLSNETIAAPDLAARIDGWEATGLPLILCVGLPPELPAQTGHTAVQRRIDLLAIEQNAWRLAARDARALVVQSRTEIDWAMKNRRTIAWAPSKLVLDIADGPSASVRDGVALALWLAETLAADRLVVAGQAQPPAGSRVPVVHEPV